MIRHFKKRWLLKYLYKECRFHSINLSIVELQRNMKYSVAREALVLQIANRTLKSLSPLFRWRKIRNEEKIKERIHNYNSIFDECVNENLAHVEKENTLVDSILSGTFLNPPNRPFFRTTDIGDKFIFTFYYKLFIDNAVAKAIIIAIITTLTGISLTHIFSDKIPSPSKTATTTVNVYPNIYVQPTK